MTYVREQTSAELAAHMRSLQAMPGWFDPLADRLWQEVQSLQRDNAALMLFSGFVLNAHRNDGYPGDLDGGTLQDWAVQCGLLEERTVYERCCSGCTCAEIVGADEWFDGVRCYFLTELGSAVRDAAKDKQ